MDAPTLEELVPLPQIWERLGRVETRLLEVSHSDDAFLTRAAQHLLIAGGKRFRPLLAQLASEFGPADDQRSIDAAVAVELAANIKQVIGGVLRQYLAAFFMPLFHHALQNNVQAVYQLAGCKNALSTGKVGNINLFEQILSLLAGQGIERGLFKVKLILHKGLHALC